MGLFLRLPARQRLGGEQLGNTPVQADHVCPVCRLPCHLRLVTTDLVTLRRLVRLVG